MSNIINGIQSPSQREVANLGGIRIGTMLAIKRGRQLRKGENANIVGIAIAADYGLKTMVISDLHLGLYKKPDPDWVLEERDKKILHKTREIAEASDIKLSTHCHEHVEHINNPKNFEMAKLNVRIRVEMIHEAGSDLSVWHPGGYIHDTERESVDATIDAVNRIMPPLWERGMEVKLGIETMPMHHQVGILEDVAEICANTQPYTRPVFDVGHTYLRQGMPPQDEYYDWLFDRIESLFGYDELSRSFIHTQGICLGRGREIHCDFDSPENVMDDVNTFARAVLERRLQPEIIIESKSVLQDSVKLVKIFNEELEDEAAEGEQV